MKYKVIVLDLDGTLTNSNKKISPKTKAILIDAQKKGLKVVLASGRPTYGVLPLAEELELKRYGGYILSYNGANIIDCSTDEMLFGSTLPEDSIPVIADLAKQYQVDLLSYEGDSIITDNKENIYAMKESKINQLPLRQVGAMEDYIHFPVTKFIMLGDSDHLVKVESPVRDTLGEHFSVYRSEGYFLEIMPENIDKAQSLERLLAHLELSKEQMIACGDGFNDLSMLEYAGLGVAMENAIPQAKEIADYVTASNDEDGIAQVVEKFFFGK